MNATSRICVQKLTTRCNDSLFYYISSIFFPFFLLRRAIVDTFISDKQTPNAPNTSCLNT
ncbi:hypothetical protein CW304_21240 [Bacillus sp. UFRGS-B20]|nr:hypothetical protein CW304_21240 [Bacillus sp. UFRGS-B20]